MKKIKSDCRLLLESGFTRKEIKEMRKNSKLFGIELTLGVSDVGKRMLRAIIIFGGIFFAFFITLFLQKSLKVVLAFSFFWVLLLLLSCFLTNIPRYAKSVVFYFKNKKNTYRIRLV